MKLPFSNITFQDPWFLSLLIIIPVVVWWNWRNRKRASPALHFSTLKGVEALPKTFRQRTRSIPYVLRLAAIALCITAMARPQGHLGKEQVIRESIDIVLTMDISKSMLAEDFDENRLAVSKKLAKDFIDGRPDDRFGLVAFSGESVTRCALTPDHPMVKKRIDQLNPNSLPQGTAIGMGLATAVSRLKDSEAKSKVIILLTDGENNRGVIAPLTAAEMAQVFGIRVYTIGVGSIGHAKMPVSIDMFGNDVFDYVEVRIDEPMLTSIANMTGGKYFRAVDEHSLENIFNEIDQMEKTKIVSVAYRNKPERFFWIIVAAAGLFFTEIILRILVYRTIP